MDYRVAQILKTFDFAKVYRVMYLLDWKWQNTNALICPTNTDLRKAYNTPTVGELKEFAETLLNKVILYCKDFNVSSYYIKTGGFKAEMKADNSLHLLFILEEKDHGSEI